MMVTVGSESIIQPLLGTLDCKASKVDDKIDAYNELTRLLSPKPENEEFAAALEDIISNITETVRVLVADLTCDSNELVQVALLFLGTFIHNNSICKSLDENESKQILNALSEIIRKTSDKVTCTRAMFCITRQNVNRKVLEEELHSLLSTIEYGQCQKNFQSVTVELEALNAIIRLLEQLPTRMVPHAGQWGKLVYPLLLHSVPKVREKALMAMDIGKSAILQEREEIASYLLPDLKAMLISSMENLMKGKQEIHVLKVWSFYVQLLGKSLHTGGLINQILPVVELGFKNSNPNVKVAAYKAWECLIDNFALNPDIISDHKRVKLIMQVFKINNTKMEIVALEKLRVWWHFVIKLNEKASQYFEQVCAPLLNYCFFGTANPAALGTPGKPGLKTPNSKLGPTPFASPSTPGSANNPPPTYKSVQSKGAQVLSMIISKQASQRPAYTMPKLEKSLAASSTFFTKHWSFILNITKGCLLCCGNDIAGDLLCHIWHSIVTHVHNVLEDGQKDRSSSDVFSVFMGCFREMVESKTFDTVKLLKLFNYVMNLPARVMSSSAYSTGGIMNGCPAQTLTNLLLDPKLFQSICESEMLFVLLEKLVAFGMKSSDPLGFCQSTVASIEQVVDIVKNKESLWRLWSTLANPLLEHIQKSNEVNQGNNLEYDFSCLYSMLLFPITKIPSSEIPTATEKSMMITWAELYKEFARLSAMVANAEENIACEELLHQIASHLTNSPEKVEDARFLYTLSHVCQVIVDVINFSSISPAPTFNFAQISPSPAKKRMKKRGTLGCLLSLVTVLEKTISAVKTLDESNKTFGSEDKNSSPLQLTTLNVIHVLSTLYNHVDKSPIISEITSKLGPGIAYIIQASGKKNVSKISSNQVNSKVEKLWTDMCTCLQGHMSGSYSTEFLAQISPVLEVTFTHQKRPIKTQTIMMWNVTFGTSGALDYPESLKPVLAKVKEKTHLTLPGWESVQVSAVEDSMAVSQMSMAGESQVPLPNVPGINSPRKPVGSFLTKPPVSPKITRSPLKVDKGPTPQKTRRKLSVDLQDMNTQDFVVIKPSPQKKRLLTDHQKEMLKEKHVIPALYSNVDASQDVSLMNQFTTDTQMSETNTPSPTETPITEITPFPTFGKSLAAVGNEKKKEIEEATAIDQKTPETETSLKPQRRASSRKVRFTGDTDDERSNGPTHDEFAAKIKAVKDTLQSSQDIDEITKCVQVDKAAQEANDDGDDDLAEPMETDDVPDTAEESVAMSEEIPLTAPEATKSSRVAPTKKWSDQSNESSQLSDCSKEVAGFCAAKSKGKAVDSPKKAADDAQPKVKRGRGRPPKSPEKRATPVKKGTKIDEKQAIDKFLVKSAEKLKVVRGVQISDSQSSQESIQSKVSESDAILVNDTMDPSTQQSPRKQYKVSIANETPVKEGNKEADKSASDNDSPNEIPDSQTSAGSLTPQVMASKSALSPSKEHKKLDDGMLENLGLSTPTKSKLSPGHDITRSPVVQLVRLSQQDIANYSPKKKKVPTATLR